VKKSSTRVEVVEGSWDGLGSFLSMIWGLRASDAFFSVGVCVLRDWLEHGTTTSMMESF
jgi:hypothetical protein